MKKQSGNKLVEILAVELKEWPARVAYFGCDVDGEIRAYDVHGGADEYHNRFDFFPEVPVANEDRANGFGYFVSPVVVTRDQWQAAKDKLEGNAVKATKANKGGWVLHRGGKCPVEAGALVDVRFRDGKYAYGKPALERVSSGGRYAEDWSHDGDIADIMAYRLHTHPNSPQPLRNP